MADTQTASPADQAQSDGDPGPIDVLALSRGMVRAMQMSDEHTGKAEKMLDHFANGGTFSDMYGLKSSHLEAVYSMARTLYNNRKYDDAVTMFQFLCYMEHMEKKYWMGKGATHQMLKQYDDALSAYGMATTLDIDDPRPQLQAGFCLIQMGHKEEAIAALEGSILAADATDATKLQAEALLSKLEADTVGAGA